ncbi:MAG: hypothetical protein HN509_10290 [Halobacteriovoraceae bacterium]|nr:hypothetical protein [Halobacteriovoraceae bacterium]MBT5094561.1 hypothetical protein [Halobacteriovoraceae bacterium]
MEVILGIDKIERLEFAPSTKIQVGNQGILAYELIPSKRELTFKGLKPGTTSVTVRNTVGDIKARYVVNITASDQSKQVKELKELIGDIEGLEIGIKGDKVYVGGNIVVPSDIGRVVAVLENEDYQSVLRLVELSPQTQRIIAKKMQNEIQKSQLKDVTVRVVNSLFWLEGIVTSGGDRKRAEDISIAYLPDRIESLARRKDSVQQVRKNIIQNFIQVNQKKKPQPVPKLIKISAQFVELVKDYNKIFGFKWNPVLSGDGGSIGFGKTESGGVTTKSQGTLSGTISNLFPKLASAKSAGYARVIQSGVIVTKDKRPATIQKKTEKPFAIGSGEFVKSETAVSGFTLNVTPSSLPEEKIDLRIDLSVNATVGDPPATITNQIKTEIVVKSKKTAVVGGVVVNKSSTDFDRNPPFGEDDFSEAKPVFSFLRSKSYVSNKSQFVVFVTPEIIESASTGTEKIKRKFRRRRR